jgi:hypothetical protein
MKANNLPAIILAVLGTIIAVGALVNSEKLSDSKFEKAMATAAGAFMGAAGACQVINNS